MIKITNNDPVMDLKGNLIAEITREWFYHVLEAVPPLMFGQGWFICGEAYSSDKEGHLLYHHYIHDYSDDKFYVIGPFRPLHIDGLYSKFDELKNK